MEDLKNIAESLNKCREIKQEILRYGVNQLEIMKLIKLLALELEDRNKMNQLINCIDSKHEGLILQEE